MTFTNSAAFTESTPDHSSLSVVRQRLSRQRFEAVRWVLWRALRSHGLLKGRKLGMHSSVMEASAGLRALAHRNSQKDYRESMQGFRCTRAERAFSEWRRRAGRDALL